MKKMDEMMNEIRNMLISNHEEDAYENLLPHLYAAEKMKEAGEECSYEEMLNVIADDPVREAVRKSVRPENFDSLKEITKDCTEGEMNKALRQCKENRSRNREAAVGDSLSKLLKGILKTSSAQSILALGYSGLNDFTNIILSEKGNSKVKVVCRGDHALALAKMRAEQFDSRVTFSVEDPFDGQIEKADAVFSFPPMGWRAQENESEYLSDLGIQGPASSAYAYAVLSSDLMKENGRAAVLMCTADLNSSRKGEKESRKWLVDNEMAEAVVLLPGGLVHGTGVDTALLILSHGNEQVRFVDVKEAGLYKKERREAELDPSQMKKIIDLLNSEEDSSFARTISSSEISSHEYSLDFHQYLAESLMVKDGIKFKSVMEDISRGAQMVSKKMKALETDEHTSCRYLAISDVENGMIRSDLSYLKEIPEKMEKYCVQDGDLLISRSYPFKTAVAKVEEGEQILLSGNFYRIEVDSSKANPYFIKAFLESRRGSEILEMLGKGTAIPMISASDLKELMLPLPDMKTQNRVAESYLAAQQDVITSRGRYEQALEKLAGTYDREMSEE